MKEIDRKGGKSESEKNMKQKGARKSERSGKGLHKEREGWKDWSG